MESSLERILKDTLDELHNIKGWIDNNKLDSKVRYLNAYSVIKASGTIEQVYKNIVFGKLSENANEHAKNYLTKQILDASFNPGTGIIQKMLQNINSNWWIKLDNEFKTSKLCKQDLNSLIQLRNSIAHGNTINESIDNILRYYLSSKDIMECLYNIMHSE